MAEIHSRAVRFHVQRMGSGSEVVVFVHGLVMDNLSSFYYTLAPAVAGFAEVILYDIRGHGLTERPPTGYTLHDLLLDHAHLLDQLEVKRRVWLVGHSFGGLLATALSVTQPERVAGMVLLDPLSPLDGWQGRMVATLGLEGEERNLRIAESFSSWLGRHSRRKSTRLAKNAETLVNKTTLLQDLSNSPGMTEQEVARISCSTLIVVGEHSDVRPEAEMLGSLIKHSSEHVVPDCTHSVLWEQTAEVQRVSADWLSTQIQGS